MNSLASALKELSWIHSLIKHLLSTYCVPAPITRTVKAVITKTILCSSPVHRDIAYM